jgi:predicted  nucleic acid-binding Zn-ribbon protein
MTLEELQAQLLDLQEKTKTLVADNETLKSSIAERDKRVKDLEEHNQKLFLRITTPGQETKEDKEEIPAFLNKDTFNLLDKHDKALLNTILEEE